MRIGLHLNAGVPDRSGGAGDHRRRRHRAVSHRARLHGARPLPDVATQTRALRQGARAGAATSRWCSARSTSAATSSCPTGPSRTRTNPAMGWRAMRMALDRPAMLRTQLRALIRSARGGRARRDVSDGRRGGGVRRGAAAAGHGAGARRGSAASRCRAPCASARCSRCRRCCGSCAALLPRIDFLSIGTQRSAAVPVRLRSRQSRADRSLRRAVAAGAELHARAGRALPRAPGSPSRSAVRWRRARSRRWSCSGLGVRQLSMTPTDIGPVKAMLRSLRCGQLAGYLGQLCDLPDHSLRDRLRHYALDHGVRCISEGYRSPSRGRRVYACGSVDCGCGDVMLGARSGDRMQVDPAESLMREVGAQLRRRRLERGEDLDDVAKSLRIKPSYLVEIEQGDLTAMPGRPYALGFLRSYADYLGFDGDDLVDRIKAAVADLTDRTRLRIRMPLAGEPAAQGPGRGDFAGGRGRRVCRVVLHQPQQPDGRRPRRRGAGRSARARDRGVAPKSGRGSAGCGRSGAWPGGRRGIRTAVEPGRNGSGRSQRCGRRRRA